MKTRGMSAVGDTHQNGCTHFSNQALDDGLGIGSSLRDCSQNSVFVRQSLIDAGFLINEDKSIFTPVQSLEWLGIVWNSLD
jgi:hypothetical protein